MLREFGHSGIFVSFGNVLEETIMVVATHERRSQMDRQCQLTSGDAQEQRVRYHASAYRCLLHLYSSLPPSKTIFPQRGRHTLISKIGPWRAHSALLGWRGSIRCAQTGDRHSLLSVRACVAEVVRAPKVSQTHISDRRLGDMAELWGPLLKQEINARHMTVIRKRPKARRAMSYAPQTQWRFCAKTMNPRH